MESFTKSAQRLPNILLTSFPWRRVHFFASDHILISVSQINCNWPHDICLNHQKTLTKRSIKRERCENRIVKRPVKVVRDRSRDSLTKKCGRKSQYISTIVECPFLHLFIGYDDYLKKLNSIHLYLLEILNGN